MFLHFFENLTPELVTGELSCDPYKIDLERANPHDNETMADSSFEVVGKEDDWAMVEGGNFKGTSLLASDTILTSENTRDVDRWKEMPSLIEYSNTLRELNLFKNRYIRELHPSVCELVNLVSLSLVRCERLQTLPDDIGKLKNLKELNLTDASEIAFLPD